MITERCTCVISALLSTTSFFKERQMFTCIVLQCITIDEALSNICVLMGRVVNKIKKKSVFDSKILLRNIVIGITGQHFE